MTIVLPPLRARGEDILQLFTRLSEQFAEEYGCDAPQVTAQEAAQLLQAPWPGNVRQLVNIAERAVLQNRRGSGSIASLLMADNEASGPALTTEGKPLKEYVEAFEKMLIDKHDAPAQGQHRRGDGGAVPAAPHPEREDGQVRASAPGLRLTQRRQNLPQRFQPFRRARTASDRPPPFPQWASRPRPRQRWPGSGRSTPDEFAIALTPGFPLG